MTLEPNVIVLYVENLNKSSQFYQQLFSLKPDEESATFHSFKFSSGLSLGLKAKNSVVPAVDNEGGGEIAFTVDRHEKVDALYAQWQENKVELIAAPTTLPYGYTFVATDPDGHRLRVAALN